MTRDEMYTLALQYTDRLDSAILATMSAGLYDMVVARINRQLRVREQNIFATFVTSSTLGTTYTLPQYFAGIRDIKLVSSDGKIAYSLQLVTPEFMNDVQSENSSMACYTLIGATIDVNPRLDNYTLAINYYSKVAPLPLGSSTDWLSLSYPDIYVCGLATEIFAFTKDAEAAALWDKRFTDAINEFILVDSIDRWSGPPLSQRAL
jgi:hypothetical protein